MLSIIDDTSSVALGIAIKSSGFVAQLVISFGISTCLIVPPCPTICFLIMLSESSVDTCAFNSGVSFNVAKNSSPPYNALSHANCSPLFPCSKVSFTSNGFDAETKPEAVAIALLPASPTLYSPLAAPIGINSDSAISKSRTDDICANFC